MKAVPKAAVAVVFFSPTGQVLLFKDADPLANWHLPVSFMEPGTDWNSTLTKGMRVQTGMSVLKGRLVGLYSGKEFRMAKDAEGNEISPAVAVFFVKEFHGRPPSTGPQGGAQWFSPNNLPLMMDDTHTRVIQEALSFTGEVVFS